MSVVPKLKKGKSQFVSSDSISFLKDRLCDLLGLTWISMALLYGILLISYHPNDPSFNTATDVQSANLLGLIGSYIADMALQFFGLASLLPIPIFLRWGYQTIRQKSFSAFWPKLALTLISILFFSMALAVVPSPSRWLVGGTLGGVIGDLLLRALSKAAAIPSRDLLSFLSLVISSCLLIYVLNIKDIIIKTLKYLWGQMTSVVSFCIGRRETKNAVRLEHTPSLPAELHSVKEEATNKAVIKALDKVEKVVELEENEAGELPKLTASQECALPPQNLVVEKEVSVHAKTLSPKELTRKAEELEAVLTDYGIRGKIVRVNPGPVVTLYELEPAPGTKTSRVIGLADDIARSMSALSARVAVVTGRNVIGIELPNDHREVVSFHALLNNEKYIHSSETLALILGKDISGYPIIVDLARMPHLLIAGTTGSGKSVAINTMILSLLYRLTPEQCRLIMIDPKMLELSVYDGIPHLLSPVVTDPRKAVMCLKWAVREMEDRYRVMSVMGVRNIEGYNQKIKRARETGVVPTRKVQTGFDPETGRPLYETQPLNLEFFPYIVIVVDEMADLMMVAGKDIESAVQRLAQMARAAGIHLIMATQRPSVDVITGTIKANFPSRISFHVTSKIDSRTILGEQGAEQLLGQGDMLYLSTGGRLTRIHGPFVSDENVERVVAWLKSQGEPQYVDDIVQETEEDLGSGAFGEGEEDPLYQQAVAIVCQSKKASASYIQRHLKIGYNRAARIIEKMEEQGVVSSPDHVGRRKILIGGAH